MDPPIPFPPGPSELTADQRMRVWLRLQRVAAIANAQPPYRALGAVVLVLACALVAHGVLAPPPPAATTIVASDPFAGASVGLSDPPTGFAAVTPSDDNDLAITARCLWVGGAGNIKVTSQGGTTVVLVGAQAGTLIAGRFTRVWSTSTTATSIVAGW